MLASVKRAPTRYFFQNPYPMSQDTTFLDAVADAYASRYKDLKGFCFVFPNRRSCTFFRRKLKERHVPSGRRGPKVAAVADLMAELSGREVAGRIDMLFLLYNCYRRLQQVPGREETGPLPEDEEKHRKENEALDFEAFRSWGEIVLSDFEEVDMYKVDPDELFRNLKDFRSIASNHLTEEQRKVMEEYFGYSTGIRESVERLWRSFEPETPAKNRFLYLWQMLRPLYHALKEELEERNLTTPSGAFRITLDRLQEAEGNPEALRRILPWKKMVFVGFNALSFVEREIFRFCQDLPGASGESDSFADFLWDGTGPVLDPPSEKGNQNHPATNANRFLLLNRRDFPSPDWASEYLHRADRRELPEIRVVASPSNSYQAKIAGEEIGRWAEDPSTRGSMENARVAVVLPDENLLLPMVYSIPENIGKVNLTMGYPLRLTSTMSFISLYRSAQRHVRNTPSGPAFYHKDLRRLLGHPLVHSVVGGKATADLNGMLNTTHAATVSAAMIRKVSEPIARLLVPLAPHAGAEEGAENLRNTLVQIKEALEEGRQGGGMLIRRTLDSSHIEIYLEALSQLSEAARKYGLTLNADTFFVLADRMLGGQQVTFRGEPLEGLQVMGMLETRALDFDKIIIPSANERQLPKAGRTSSFIPNALRPAFCMPPMQHQEALSAYYFYRLISRAREVVMIYDARAGAGTRANDVSRYILQLQHIHARGKIKVTEQSFQLNLKRNPVSTIEKAPEIVDELRKYITPRSGKRLSLTSFHKYLQCGLRFFYEYLMGIHTDETPSEFISNATQGTIVHKVMELLYAGSSLPSKVSQKEIEAMYQDEERIRRMVREAIIREHYHQEDTGQQIGGAAEMVIPVMTDWVRSILLRDLVELRLADAAAGKGQESKLVILGTELEDYVSYPVGDGREVNFKYVVDRLQMPFSSGSASNPEMLTMIDYKTGSTNTCIQSIEEVLDGDHSTKIPLQLLLYSELFNHHRLVRGQKPVGIEPLIYNIPEMLYASKKESEAYRALCRREGMVSPLLTGAKDRDHLGIKPLVIENEEYMESGKVDEDGALRCHAGVAEEFRGLLQEKLRELFDPTLPFTAPSDAEHCRYCPLGMLCGR